MTATKKNIIFFYKTRLHYILKAYLRVEYTNLFIHLFNILAEKPPTSRGLFSFIVF